MEWYFRNEIDDLVVPKYHEQWEMVSSPDSWSPWGITAFGGSDLPEKNFNAPTKVTHEELTSNEATNFNRSMDMDDSSYGRQHSNNSSMCQGPYSGGASLEWNDHTDYQQFTDEQDRINRMDDLLFNSLLEEEPTKYSTKSHNTMIPGDNVNIFKGDMLSSHNIPSHGQSIGSSKYLKTHAFSPSLDWENGEVSSTCEMLKQYTSEENSMEQSVLQELERVTAQFTDTTRICLRDALYRLAENSKQTVNSCQDGEPMLTSNDNTLGGGKTEVSESETNAIDRAVANLMYSKICFDDQNADVQQQLSYCQGVMDAAGDAEVPIVGMDAKQPTFNLDAYI